MHVLITNDDGIFAPGIRAIAEAAAKAGHRVTVFAPNGQRSAASRSMTISTPITFERVDMEGAEAYAVGGTPVDCVRLALYMMKGKWPDIVIAGINQGPNRGVASGYSGTIGAAMESAIYGIPSIALSVCSYTAVEFETAAELGVRMMDWVLRHPLPNGEIYSLNVPLGEVRGVRPATLSNEFTYKLNFRKLSETLYEPLWDDTVVPETDENSDLLVTNAGYASLSVLTQSMLSAVSRPDMRDFPNGIAHNGMEIERKFLIRMPEEETLRAMPGCEVWDIVQTYLFDGPDDVTRRVREIGTDSGTKYLFTEKRRISDLTHEESERELTRTEYDKMLSDADPALHAVRKRRFRIPYDGHLMEIDVYAFWNDRATLETEIQSEGEPVNLPPWLEIIREVTGDGAYKNRRLAESIPNEKI